MRINVTGDCPTAKAIRGYLGKYDFHLTDHEPDWTIHIEEPGGTPRPSVDGVGGELEQAILGGGYVPITVTRHLRKQMATTVEIETGRTVSSEREIRVLVPSNDPDRRAVEIGVFRGLLEMSGSKPQQTRWWQRKSK